MRTVPLCNMLSLFVVRVSLILIASSGLLTRAHCPSSLGGQQQFGLVHACQRSTQTIVALENTQTLEECMEVASDARGLALNYAPLHRRQRNKERVDNSSATEAAHFIAANRKRNRQHYWQQPEEFFNCHVLQCPENATLRSMINDSRFDYYSLYGGELDTLNYTCLPELGFFELHDVAQNFVNASSMCRQRGALAHVASAARTNGLASLLTSYNALRKRQHTLVFIQLAFVGLHLNRTSAENGYFVNDEMERLECFLYRAWAPGHPKHGDELHNRSCVALTAQRTWLAIDCDRVLPFICEIYRTPASLYGLDTLEEECIINRN